MQKLQAFKLVLDFLVNGERVIPRQRNKHMFCILMKFGTVAHLNKIRQKVFEKLPIIYKVKDRQPRRFIYPKDGGRFDAPKMHVFTHLLRKCFTGKSKVRLRPPKSTIYGGSKWPLFTPKTAWIKIA